MDRPAESGQPVRQRAGHIVTITLANPAKRNALSLEVMQGLIGELRQIATTDARGVVLAADGPAFSAGHDFTDMAGADFTAGDLAAGARTTGFLSPIQVRAVLGYGGCTAEPCIISRARTRWNSSAMSVAAPCAVASRSKRSAHAFKVASMPRGPSQG